MHPKIIDFYCDPVEVSGGDAALRLCFLRSSVFWRVGDISGRPPFGEWCPDPAYIAASVIQSAMKAAGLCVCRKRHCGGVGVFVSVRLFTHSLAHWNSFVMKLIAPWWTRGFPGSWEFNECDGWSADRISQSVDGGISPEITEIYRLISSMRSSFTPSTLSFFPALWCAELSQPAKQVFEWRGKQLSHLLFYFEPPSVSVQSAVTLVSESDGAKTPSDNCELLCCCVLVRSWRCWRTATCFLTWIVIWRSSGEAFECRRCWKLKSSAGEQTFNSGEAVT